MENNQNENLLNNSQSVPADTGESGQNQNPDQSNSIQETPGQDNSVIREMRKQLKEATKKLTEYQQKEQQLTQAEQLKKGEYEKVLTEKEKELAEAKTLLANLQKEKALNETLTKSNANPKYLDLIKANLTNVSDDELGEKVEELKANYPEFFEPSKVTIPSTNSNFQSANDAKVITKEQYDAMLARGENAIELLNKGYKFNF